MNLLRIERALISVYDKTNLLSFVKELRNFGITIYASGGTYNFLKNNGFIVNSTEELTGIVSILDGRVKTLHPSIHASILADKGNENHLKQLQEMNLNPIDLVVVNFYPFEKVVEQKNISELDIIENIDIGGPTLVRSAAKNFNSVIVVTEPGQYDVLIEELNFNNGFVTLNTRRKFAEKAFQKLTKYDIEISNYFNKDNFFNLSLNLEKTLRYGENPHQFGWLYGEFESIFNCIHGKELSYNNILDITSAMDVVLEFDEIACAIIKHNSPCGVALGNSTFEAYEKALKCDPVSAFGGIVAFNKPIDEDTAKKLNEIFLELILLPEISDSVLSILKIKKDRRLVIYSIDKIKHWQNRYTKEFRSITGGVVVQTKDLVSIVDDKIQIVSDSIPDDKELDDMKFAFKVSKHVKSNSIVIAKGRKTIGICGGQTSRVDSVRFAIFRAKQFNHNLKDAVMASDGFFPFYDGIELAAKEGIKAIIQPGGSIRDNEIKDFVNKNKIKMAFTNIRHFKH